MRKGLVFLVTLFAEIVGSNSTSLRSTVSCDNHKALSGSRIFYLLTFSPFQVFSSLILDQVSLITQSRVMFPNSRRWYLSTIINVALWRVPLLPYIFWFHASPIRLLGSPDTPSHNISSGDFPRRHGMTVHH